MESENYQVHRKTPYLWIWGYKMKQKQLILVLASVKLYDKYMKYKSNNNVVYSCKYHVVASSKNPLPLGMGVSIFYND